MISPDTVLFFRSFLRNPFATAAVVPSSPALADLMTAEIDHTCAPILELGAGTGVFTRSILARGVPEDQIALVERNPDFVRTLHRRFPEARVLHTGAETLRRWPMAEAHRPGAVVSGLPLLSMPLRHVIAILSGAFRQLRKGGAFYQFTYGFGCPVARPILQRLSLEAVRIGRTFSNLPPASVYRLKRLG